MDLGLIGKTALISGSTAGIGLATASEGASNFVTSLAKQRGVSEAEVEKEFFESVRPSLIKRFATSD